MSVNDKVAHFVLFFVLGGALAVGRSWSGLAVPHWIAIAVGMAYGALDEFHQSTVPNRVPSLDDWYADVAGVWVGYLLVTYIVRRTGRTSGASTRTN